MIVKYLFPQIFAEKTHVEIKSIEKSFKILGSKEFNGRASQGLKNGSVSEDLSREGSREQERQVTDNSNDRQQTVVIS